MGNANIEDTQKIQEQVLALVPSFIELHWEQSVAIYNQLALESLLEHSGIDLDRLNV